MSSQASTVIVTGASQGIGAACASLLLERGYNVVCTSRHITGRNELPASDQLMLVDGDIAQPATADSLVAAALARFGAVDALVNNAGIFISKPFIDYSAGDLAALSAINVEGFMHLTQRVMRQLLVQGRGGSIVNITASIADHPLTALPASVAMITKGGINAITRSLALEYAAKGIRVNAVAPGVVDTPLLKGVSRDFLRSLSPLGTIAEARDIAGAVFYLLEASQVTGEVLHVDGGLHVGKW